jgi:AraC-like DNA-binding protein
MLLNRQQRSLGPVADRTHRVEQHRSSMPGVEAMTLASARAFPRHSHDQFGIGIMTFGAQRSWSGVGLVESQVGDVITANPGEMHDGLPIDGRVRSWRILYLDPTLVAREVAEEAIGVFEIAAPVMRDPRIAGVVDRLFTRATEPRPNRLAAEEDLLRSLMQVVRPDGLRRGAKSSAAKSSTAKSSTAKSWSMKSSPAVSKALQRLDDAPEMTTSLAELAALSGVSRFQLLRGFVREVGATPHAYLIQRRVGLVRELLAAGQSPAQAALRAGFADQSHMTRAFVRQFGITPGRYRSAVV